MARLALVLERGCGAWRRAGWGASFLLALAAGPGASWSQLTGDVKPAEARAGRPVSFDVYIRHRREVVFVNSGASERKARLRAPDRGDLTRSLDVIWLGPAGDGVTRVPTALATRSGIDAVHVLSHGLMNVSALFGNGGVRYGLGPEVDYTQSENLHAGVGYPFVGFEDSGLTPERHRPSGFFLAGGWRFDPNLFLRRKREDEP